ncbi:MAG: DUF1289 domain-containing protein [Paraglaciecola sp.]|uniref:DUF1289 domain-containing protein n=1 Tax=Paraglaciecola sp. TaxID=1920173 RepID=UPI00329689C3
MNNSNSSDVQSPCVRNCCLDDKDMCLGCFRVIDEILVWGEADNNRKVEILALCESRRKAHINSHPF